MSFHPFNVVVTESKSVEISLNIYLLFDTLMLYTPQEVCFILKTIFECVFVNAGLFVGVKVIYTSRSAPRENFTPFIAYVNLLVSQIPFSDCPVKATETKSPFITLGNSDVRPDSELGSHPIQLERINEKCCTNHP